MMERVAQLVWLLLAVASVCLIVRRRAEARGVWLLVTASCCVIAVDKFADLQVKFYRFMQWSLRTSEELLGVTFNHRFVRGLLLVMGTIAIVLAIWLVMRRDRDGDRGKQMAIAGLVLVVLLVGLRLLPWFDWLAKNRAGWVIEATACCLVGLGLRAGFVKNHAPT